MRTPKGGIPSAFATPLRSPLRRPPLGVTTFGRSDATPAAAVVVKEPWTWQKSMFAPLYEGECDAAFERDWELANLDKLAGDDGGAAKETTRRAYGLFRTLFKLYCCQNKTLHTLDLGCAPWMQ